MPELLTNHHSHSARKKIRPPTPQNQPKPNPTTTSSLSALIDSARDLTPIPNIPNTPQHFAFFASLSGFA